MPSCCWCVFKIGQQLAMRISEPKQDPFGVQSLTVGENPQEVRMSKNRENDLSGLFRVRNHTLTFPQAISR